VLCDGRAWPRFRCAVSSNLGCQIKRSGLAALFVNNVALSVTAINFKMSSVQSLVWLGELVPLYMFKIEAVDVSK
jgi:hypothetical protein